MKWVSELDPCFLVVVGHYICVKPTQGIFFERLCNSKKIVFLYKKGVVKNIKNLDYKKSIQEQGCTWKYKGCSCSCDKLAFVTFQQ
jgi:hypothetical protein